MGGDSSFLNRLLLALSRGSTRLFRNSVGLGWTGKVERPVRAAQVMVYPGDLVIRQARALHAGLVAGSGDLIGWRSFVIQPEDVGRRVAVFASLEAKEGKGVMRANQKVWRDQVEAAGGIAGEVRSVEDGKALLQQWNGVSDKCAANTCQE